MTWTLIKCNGQVPSARSGMSFVQNNGVLLVFGGSVSAQECSNKLFMLDLKCKGDFKEGFL